MSGLMVMYLSLGVDTRLFSGPSGSVLCVALIRAYDAVFVQHKDNMLQAKGSVVSALKCLLTVSTSAKGAALEGRTPVTLH